MKKISLLVAFFALSFSAINAQVAFKIGYDKEADLYTVSIIPSQTWEYPMNITGTGQVTIKVPTGEFEIANLESAQTNVNWDANSLSVSPEEASEFDYISFGLITQGTAEFNYTAGEEMELFSFQNARGCTGAIRLVDNANDEFMPPNSQNANIGNSLSVSGANGEVAVLLHEDHEVNCNPATVNTNELAIDFSYKTFPNPAIEELNVQIDWTSKATKAQLKIVDVKGAIVKEDRIRLNNGTQNFETNVSALPAGTYLIEITNGEWSLSLGSFIKK